MKRNRRIVLSEVWQVSYFPEPRESLSPGHSLLWISRMQKSPAGFTDLHRASSVVMGSQVVSAHLCFSLTGSMEVVSIGDWGCNLCAESKEQELALNSGSVLGRRAHEISAFPAISVWQAPASGAFTDQQLKNSFLLLRVKCHSR